MKKAELNGGRAALLRRSLCMVKPYWPIVTANFILSAISVAAQLYIPILTGNAVDAMIAIGRVDMQTVVKTGLYIAIAAAVMAISGWLLAAGNNRLAFSVSRDLRNRAINKIQRLPLSYIDSHPSGDVVSRVTADVDAFSDGLLMGSTQLFQGVMTILATMGFMLYVNAAVALVVVCVTPLSLITASFIAKKSYRHFKAQAEARGNQTAYVNEMIEGHSVVKAFMREESCNNDFDKLNKNFASASIKAIFFSSITNPTTRFVNNIVYAGVGLSGALLAVAGSISVGQLSIFLSYANQYTKPFNEISGVVAELQNSLASASRIYELLDQPEIPAENPAKLTADGSVDFCNVCFSYDKKVKLIENFNLQVKPGQNIAIVGPTGCGKTTLINLLMRFYDVNSGSIEVSGWDIRDFSRKSLRGSFGMVLQDTWLKHGTIKENIAYQDPSATDEQVVAAARAAHADGFIRRLKSGYDTVIDDNGGGLSQGERQLLCIARVMLRLPPMLILDEATSSIDTRTERKISAAFTEMMRGRTSFVVAHRLSTIMGADLILVMNNGKIIESGNHNELISAGGFYAELYNSQFEKM